MGLAWKLKLRLPTDAKKALEEFDEAYRKQSYLSPNGVVSGKAFPTSDAFPQGLTHDQVRAEIVKGSEIGKAVVNGRRAFRMCHE